uniref:Uncharacterized protein n=1 Tax=uncultured prokaryote TaxID=198431 RepID=A0A0H5QNG8_9ZZZZ|nr:hypothetical protein [uncultured prokaryote]
MQNSFSGTAADIARSNYRQARITITQEVDGRITASLSAKRLDSSWSEFRVVDRWTVWSEDPLNSIDDVLLLLERTLQDRRPPLD